MDFWLHKLKLILITAVQLFLFPYYAVYYLSKMFYDDFIKDKDVIEQSEED